MKSQQAVVTLNDTKCELNKKSDPDKIRAIVTIPTSPNKTELLRFFGIINYLGKFVSRLATEENNLRQLLGKNAD